MPWWARGLLLLLLLLLCAYFALPVFANNVETKERTLQPPPPGTLARIAWAWTVWQWLDSPYYAPGWWQICLCPMPNLRSTNVHESAQCKEEPNEDPVMRLRWFCVADGERGKAGLFSTTSRSLKAHRRAHFGGGETPSV